MRVVGLFLVQLFFNEAMQNKPGSVLPRLAAGLKRRFDYLPGVTPGSCSLPGTVPVAEATSAERAVPRPLFGLAPRRDCSFQVIPCGIARLCSSQAPEGARPPAIASRRRSSRRLRGAGGDWPLRCPLEPGLSSRARAWRAAVYCMPQKILEIKDRNVTFTP